MSAITTTSEISDIEIQRETAAFEMLQRQAKMLAASSLVPKDFHNNVPNCAIALSIAKRLKADTFMVIQNIDIIHGRPSWRATFLIAMVNASGRFEPLQFRVEGQEGTMSRSCVAWTKSKDDGAILEGPKITMEMAKAEGWSSKNGSKWQTMPELMLRYRAAAFFARLYAPDITLGMATAEEVQDTREVREVTPPKASESKLFKDVPDKPIYKAEVERLAAQEAGDMFTVEAPPKTPLECVNEWLEQTGTKWTDYNQTLLDNGLLDEARATPDACTDEELRSVLGVRKQLEKGGKL